MSHQVVPAPGGAARHAEEAMLWAEEQQGDSDGAAEMALAAGLEEWEGEAGTGGSSGEGWDGSEEERCSSYGGEARLEAEPSVRWPRQGTCLWREFPAGSGQLARGVSQRMLTGEACMPSEYKPGACVRVAWGLLT